MLDRNSALFYWDALYGVQPIVGGDPVFDRNSAGWKFDGRLWRKNIVDIARFEPTPLDGATRPAMLIEAGITQRGLDDAFSTYTTSGITVTADAGLAAFEDVPTDKLTSNGGNTEAYKSTGEPVSAGWTYAMVAIVRKTGSADWIMVGDRGDALWHRAWVRLSDGMIGTEQNATAYVFDRGPWWEIIVVADANVGAHTVQLAVSLGDTDNNNVAAAGKYAHVSRVFSLYLSADFSSSPIVGGSGTGRASDVFHWEDAAPVAQPMAAFSDVIALHPTTGGTIRTIFFVGADANSNPRLWLRFASSADGVTWLHDNGSVNAQATIPITIAPYDRLRAAALLYGDGDIRLVLKKNDEAAVGGARIGGGALADFSADTIDLGRAGESGYLGNFLHARHHMVRLADVDAATDGTENEELVDELDSYVLGPTGDLLAN